MWALQGVKGAIERGNKMFREECQNLPGLEDSLGAIRNRLRAAVEKYNTYRPHAALAGLTPMATINHHNLEVAA